MKPWFNSFKGRNPKQSLPAIYSCLNIETPMNQRYTTHGHVLNTEKNKTEPTASDFSCHINKNLTYIYLTDSFKFISLSKVSDSFCPSLSLIRTGCSTARKLPHEHLQAMTLLQRRESLQPSFMCCQLFLLTSLSPAVLWAIFQSLHPFASYDISGWFY